MAEVTTGVTETPPRQNRRRGDRRRGGGSFFQKHKGVVLAGGGLGAFLLISHKGGSASAAGDPNANLAAQQAALADQQAALESGITSFQPGGPAPVTDTSGGGGGDTSAASAPPDPSGTAGGANSEGAGGGGPGLVININQPAKSATAGKRPGGGKKPPAATHPPKTKGKKAPKPKTAPKGKPAPAKSKPHGTGASFHPDTHKRTPSGAKKRSPAMVESVFGAGAGAVVMGREFPGAQSHRMGPVRRSPNGDVCRTVTIDYGGHTDTHMVHNNGEYWTDLVPGMNPPSRGVPHTGRGVPV